jgi:hypothetical protein
LPVLHLRARARCRGSPLWRITASRGDIARFPPSAMFRSLPADPCRPQVREPPGEATLMMGHRLLGEKGSGDCCCGQRGGSPVSAPFADVENKSHGRPSRPPTASPSSPTACMHPPTRISSRRSEELVPGDPHLCCEDPVWLITHMCTVAVPRSRLGL